jgi:hypothetical protein
MSDVAVDMNNPATAIMGLMNSGIIQDMVIGLQEGIGSGQMDLSNLLGSMQSAISSLVPQEQNALKIEEVIDQPTQKQLTN